MIAVGETVVFWMCVCLYCLYVKNDSDIHCYLMVLEMNSWSQCPMKSVCWFCSCQKPGGGGGGGRGRCILCYHEQVQVQQVV